VQNSRRFLVAALLGMTRGRCAPQNAPFPVSFRTDVRNLQLGMMNAFGMDDLDDLDDLGAEDGNCMKTEACAHESTAGGGAKLEEIPRRCAPRNDRGSLRSSECPFSRVIPKPLLPCHSERSEESAVGNDECLRHG
jgi:hypothetical protein